MNIIDRRLNPKGKSLANRQRFLRRARRHVQEAVRKASAERRIADITDGEKISIPADGLTEPIFRPDAEHGHRDIILPGNKRRSEEHTSELQSLMRISYAVFCLKQQKPTQHSSHKNNTYKEKIY